MDLCFFSYLVDFFFSPIQSMWTRAKSNKVGQLTCLLREGKGGIRGRMLLITPWDTEELIWETIQLQ